MSKKMKLEVELENDSSCLRCPFYTHQSLIKAYCDLTDEEVVRFIRPSSCPLKFNDEKFQTYNAIFTTKDGFVKSVENFPEIPPIFRIPKSPKNFKYSDNSIPEPRIDFYEFKRKSLCYDTVHNKTTAYYEEI